ncbi:glutamate racemase [Empedobacter brevis]|uniref:Glutamate racemase n=1 Tax=Empedobacter brevis TaxID=247 RepID=A0AAJ1V9T8_9FLAO|nr:glutamate racemase [Empedobacter brevis]MDM1074222.1 glutamate racemase [Empedobacter brevis]QES91347.1 glutamate racemase [Empedobacter brevis]QHC86382.1 glutamate racemase [Empedobacter brevis]
MQGPIGVFDSGYGGLTVFKEIQKQLPQYDYIYLGDNARVPYGIRSFETVYEYTKECVFKLFDLGCNLVILACNTASAKALRSIQQHDLPEGKKVLGVIRPTTESINEYTVNGKVGILATQGTVLSESYKIEINKFHPAIEVFQHPCPLWVPLVENNEIDSKAAHDIIEKDIQRLFSQSSEIDTIVLACTHYPLLLPVIKEYVPDYVTILSQGELVANKLIHYLERHPEVETQCSKNGTLIFYTTDDAKNFEANTTIFYGKQITASHISL